MQLSLTFLVCLIIVAFAAAEEVAPISFSFSHILDGLAPADCNGANFASCSNTIKQAVADIISIDSNSVDSVSFADPVQVSGFRRLQGASQTKVFYVVSTESATETYDSLTNTLISAIDAGTFTTVMQGFGSANALAAATALSQANGGQLTATNTLGPRDASSKLTGTMIAGLVIGIVLCLVLLGVLIAFFLQCKKNEADFIAANANAKPVSTKETA